MLKKVRLIRNISVTGILENTFSYSNETWANVRINKALVPLRFTELEEVN